LSESSPVFEVLLIEDNDADVDLTRLALESGSYPSHITVCKDGTEALTFLRGHPQTARPHLILLDWNLPNLSGDQVLSLIREDSALKSIPVVVFTSSESEVDVNQAYQLGANCFVTKSMDLEQFFGVIRGVRDFWASSAGAAPKQSSR
jgi:chemotaxis family two-component system response regulator Rcp1